MKDVNFDNLTVKNIDITLRLLRIELSDDLIVRLIDVVKLVLSKGDKVTFKDIENLKMNYKQQKLQSKSNSWKKYTRVMIDHKILRDYLIKQTE